MLQPEKIDQLAVQSSLSAEGQGISLHAWGREGELEGALTDRAGLADRLVQPRLDEGAVALVVDVAAMGGTRRLLIQAHPELVAPVEGWLAY
jgi:hypothetical protein